jgi:hypothetical protein
MGIYYILNCVSCSECYLYLCYFKEFCNFLCFFSAACERGPFGFLVLWISVFAMFVLVWVSRVYVYIILLCNMSFMTLSSFALLPLLSGMYALYSLDR